MKAADVVEAVLEEAPERPSFEIKILRAEFDQDFRQLFVEFEVPDAPKMPWSKVAGPVVLEAYVPVKSEPRADLSRRLSSGDPASESTALVTAASAEPALGPLWGATPDRNAPVPIMPSDEEVAAACEAALRRHIAAVEQEQKRYNKVEEAATTLVGRSLRVKG